jgi:hypothetical protein
MRDLPQTKIDEMRHTIAVHRDDAAREAAIIVVSIGQIG